MDKAELTMIENLQKNSGKSLEEWINIVKSKNFDKHGEIINFLKTEFSLGYGYANLIAHKTNKTDAGSVENQDDLITEQYKGKEHLKPIYDFLLSQIQNFGSNFEIAPKKTYVSLRRKKQFATLGVATKTRFEIGLNLKEVEPSGKLEAINTANAMCSHRINLSSLQEITPEVVNWIKKSFESAG